MVEEPNFKELIKNLREKMENAVHTLKELELRGNEDSANLAIWVAYDAWNGKEYSALERALRTKGHKSSLDAVQSKQK